MTTFSNRWYLSTRCIGTVRISRSLKLDLLSSLARVCSSYSRQSHQSIYHSFAQSRMHTRTHAHTHARTHTHRLCHRRWQINHPCHQWVSWWVNSLILEEQIFKQCQCPSHIKDGTLTNLHNEQMWKMVACQIPLSLPAEVDVDKHKNCDVSANQSRCSKLSRLHR